MRVKITKTLHANDIAGETRRMLDGVKNKIIYTMADRMSEITRASLSNDGDEYFRSIQLIESFRNELGTVDESLQEIQNIMQGYKDVLMPSSQVEDEDWLEHEQAEYEKFMSQVEGSEEGFDEEG